MFKNHILNCGKGPFLAKPYSDYIPERVITKECNDDYVGSALRDEAEKWTHDIPVIIDAGTGRGKNRFTYDVLLPIAQRRQGNVLMLCNRVALATQIKLGVMEAIDSPKKNYFRPEGLRNESDFGFVRVITYHRLPGFLKDSTNQEWIRNVLYVVADEAHMLTSDALYNPDCDAYFRGIIENLYHAVRIYMTATSENVLVPIAVREREKMERGPARPFYMEPWHIKRYYFPRSFDHLDIQFFDTLNEIKEMIGPPKEEHVEDFVRWLIFVDNKEKGRAFAEKLGAQAIYLDSESKGTEQWDRLLAEERFDAQCLICTSLLDCGVNLKDERLCSIAICSDDLTGIRQMVGRKRIMNKKERVNVYIQNLSPVTIGRRSDDYEKAMGLFLRLEDAKQRRDLSEETKLMRELWREPNNFFRVLFYVSKNRLWASDQGRYAVGRKLFFYKSMKDPRVDFQRAVLQMFQKPIENAALDSLNEFCQEMEGYRLDQTDIDSLKNYLKAALIEMGEMQPHDAERFQDIKHTAINNRFRALGCQYQLSKELVLEASATQE